MEKQSGEFLIRLVGTFSQKTITVEAQLLGTVQLLAELEKKTADVHSLKRQPLKNEHLTVKLQMKFKNLQIQSKATKNQCNDGEKKPFFEFIENSTLVLQIIYPLD